MPGLDVAQQILPAARRPVMRQRWSDLLFLHWPVEVSAIQSLLPPGLILETFHGQAYVALVPFRMWNVHPTWFTPVPGVSDLLECNVRTYVRREDGSNPGVWFFSLDASSAIAVALARSWFALPYFYAKMRQTERRIADDHGRWHRQVTYSTRRTHPGSELCGADVVYEPYGKVDIAAEGSLEQFLIERYLLYTYRSGCLWSGRVQHAPYQFSNAHLISLAESLLASAYIVRPDILPLVHYARNVVVKVFPLQRCDLLGNSAVSG